jgi:hypothetical protein
MREDRRGLPAQRTGRFDRRRRRRPLHVPGADSARFVEERRLGELRRRLPLDRGQGEAHDFADRREIVTREVFEEREEITRHRGLAADHAGDGLRARTARRGLRLAHLQDHADEPAASEGAYDTRAGHRLFGERVRDRVGEGVRDRQRQRDVGEAQRSQERESFGRIVQKGRVP